MRIVRYGTVALVVFSVVFIIGCATGGMAGKTQAQVLEDVSPDEAYKIIKKNTNNPDFTVLDVRTVDEYRSGHLAHAKNIDFYGESFRDQLDALDKNDTYVIYCRSGGRSGQTLELMEELGFTHVYNITGGILNWKQEKLPLVR